MDQIWPKYFNDKISHYDTWIFAPKCRKIKIELCYFEFESWFLALKNSYIFHFLHFWKCVFLAGKFKLIFEQVFNQNEFFGLNSIFYPSVIKCIRTWLMNFSDFFFSLTQLEFFADCDTGYFRLHTSLILRFRDVASPPVALYSIWP